MDAAPPALSCRLPRGPVLDWASLSGQGSANVPAIDAAAQRLLVTSGRAALALALKALRLPAGSKVLVPTYHCPTMIAPVLHAGLVPEFYALGKDALPQLESLHDGAIGNTGAIIVAHYFGLPRSLADVRRWCDLNGVALIEDCAHCFFGQAGERPAGAWGDYATASLTKFFPVPEAGLLVSATHPLHGLTLADQAWKSQIKGVVDVLETATQSRRLRGLRPVLQALFALKNRRAPAPQIEHGPTSGSEAEPTPAPTDVLQGCDMSRTQMAPLAVARWAFGGLPRARIAARRRANFRQLEQALANAPGAHVLFAAGPTDAPYALPLWVDDADRVYQGLRAAGMPVFRWDRLWAGTTALDHDEGKRWSRHVIQLLCHQDLSEAEVTLMARTAWRLL